MVIYKQAGVDIKKAEKLVKRIKRIAPWMGGFSGLFPIELGRYKKPLLVASTDGSANSQPLFIKSRLFLPMKPLNLHSAICPKPCG